MTMLLIHEFYIEADAEQGDIVVYTQRCTTMPHVPNWQAHVESWADQHIPGWLDIEVFEVASTGYGIQRIKETAE
jgi:hypothetical protein